MMVVKIQINTRETKSNKEQKSTSLVLGFIFGVLEVPK